MTRAKLLRILLRHAMPQDMKIWRHNARQRLIAELGGKCVDCGSVENLTFDHVTPLTDEQAEWRAWIGANARMVLYRKEAKEGLLRIRCQRCNTRKASEPKQTTMTFDIPTTDYERVPF